MAYRILSSHPFERLKSQKSADITFYGAEETSEEFKKKIWNDARSLYENGQSLVALPHGFRPDAIFFDFDGTLVKQETLVVLAQLMECQDAISEITRNAMEGSIDFRESMDRRLQILQNTPIGMLEKASQQFELQPGLEELIQCCHSANIKLFIVSGGFREVIKPFADRFGFKDFYANQFVVEDERITGYVREELVDGEAKAAWVKKMREYHGFESPLGIGDGANDTAMLAETSVSIGFHPKEALLRVLDGFVGHKQDYRFISRALDL